jgi:hypothetical protein
VELLKIVNYANNNVNVEFNVLVIYKLGKNKKSRKNSLKVEVRSKLIKVFQIKL